MGKYEKDKRKYCKEWESTEWAKGWLQHIDSAKYKNPNDPNEAYCKICDQSLRRHLSDLQKHARSKKHRENSAVLNRTKYKSLMSHGYQATITAEKKIVDIKLALYITMHSSIRSVDHLGELLSILGKGSNLENLRLHRTKCSNMIKHISVAVH
ncbi:uncharacterized protein LOC143896920 [Temnothorax americanus]|uniref:uncharacterized protein LOC143896920 n=1 Tax=Temnothorax americanus TaxID=1964332 RepID=UPI00406796AB